MLLTPQQQLAGKTLDWVDAFPDLNSMALETAAAILKRHTGLSLDPTQVYWHRFDSAMNSPVSYSGWQHWARPVQSMTFLQLLLKRFAARDQDNLDDLQVMSGFYTDGPEHNRFDEHNEIKVLPGAVAEDFWKTDFGDLYQKRLRSFWADHGNDFVLLAKVTFLHEVAKAHQEGWLLDSDLLTLQHGLGARLSPPLDISGLALSAPASAGAALYPFSLGGFVARDVLRVVAADGRQILYLPGDVQALRAFTDHAALVQWVRDCAGDPKQRAVLLRHFSALNPLHSDDLTALHALLDKPGSALDQLDPPIEGDGFFYLRDRASADMKRQASTLLSTNADLRQRLWIGYLGAFVNVTGGIAPLAWPVALAVVGASVASMILNVKVAVQTPDNAERKQAIVNAVLNGINAVFSAPFIFSARAPLEPIEPLPDADVETVIPQSPDTPSPDAQDIELQAIERPVELLPEGSTWNSLGMIERTDLRALYTVRELPRGADPARPLIEGFAATKRFDCARKMLEGAVLRTFATPRGAVHFAQAMFDGPYVMYEIDAEGVAAASLRENLQHNTRFTLEQNGYTQDFIEQRLRQGRSLGDFANDGWLYDEVHVQADRLDISRTRLMSASELSALTDSPTAWAERAGDTVLLQGVKVSSPDGVRNINRYSIEVDGYPQNVRYDPYSASWRSAKGGAYRYDPLLRRFIRLIAPEAEPRQNAVQVQSALAELGIEVTAPWELPPLATEGAEPIPRHIHSLWIGKRMPSRFISRLLDNAQLAASGREPFQTHLYLDIADSSDLLRTVRELAQRPGSVSVHILENTPFFKRFKLSPYYAQYRAASRGSAVNYASAADVLRYRLLDSEGGIYMDVDDSIRMPMAEEPGFADREFRVRPGELLLNNLVRHSGLGMVMDFNTSNFGSLPNNPLLQKISQESLQRFLASGDLYTSRPYDFSASEGEMNRYGQDISYVTGPRVFNTVIDRNLPIIRQYRGLSRLSQGEVYLPASELVRLRALLQPRIAQYSALGGLIRIGTTASWLHTR